jgi:hypothetical protein
MFLSRSRLAVGTGVIVPRVGKSLGAIFRVRSFPRNLTTADKIILSIASTRLAQLTNPGRFDSCVLTHGHR